MLTVEREEGIDSFILYGQPMISFALSEGQESYFISIITWMYQGEGVVFSVPSKILSFIFCR